MTHPEADNLGPSGTQGLSAWPGDNRTMSGSAGRGGGYTGRVGVSAGARLYIGLIWLIAAAFPTFLVVFSIVAALQPHPGGVYSQGNGAFGNSGETVAAAWATACVLALPALLIYYGAWRQLTRSCRPEAGGLRVRGFWRTYHVPWSAVRDVRATPLVTGYRHVAFGNAKVVFMRPDGRGKAVQVSASWRRDQRDALLIRLWSPLGHPLRLGLPRDLQEAAGLPGHSERSVGEFEHEPLLFAVRPSVSLQIAQALGLGVLLAICIPFAVLGGVAVGQSGSLVRGLVLIVIFGLPSLLLVVGIARAFSQRVAVYPGMIICHGLMKSAHFFREDIGDFRWHSSGTGMVTEIVLRSGLAHQLTPTAAWGMKRGEKTLGQLRAWLAA